MFAACSRNLLPPLVGSTKGTPTAMVFPNNAAMSQSSLGGSLNMNINSLMHSTPPSCGGGSTSGSTSGIDLDTDQINLNDVLSLLPDGWDSAIMPSPGGSTDTGKVAMAAETSLGQNKVGGGAMETAVTPQCSTERGYVQGRMHGTMKTPASPRYNAQRSPRFAGQRGPAVNANVLTASHVQRANSQPGTVASGLVGLARMMSPKQQSKHHVHPQHPWSLLSFCSKKYYSLVSVVARLDSEAGRMLK